MPEGRAVLLSIAPEHAERIASGEKTVELRRRFPALPAGTRMLLYVTRPVGAIVGMTEIAGVRRGSPDVLWLHHGRLVGITRDRFDAYFAGVQEGVAIQLARYTASRSVDLATLRARPAGFIVPQSYRYLRPDESDLLPTV